MIMEPTIALLQVVDRGNCKKVACCVLFLLFQDWRPLWREKCGNWKPGAAKCHITKNGFNRLVATMNNSVRVLSYQRGICTVHKSSNCDLFSAVNDGEPVTYLPEGAFKTLDVVYL